MTLHAQSPKLTRWNDHINLKISSKNNLADIFVTDRTFYSNLFRFLGFYVNRLDSMNQITDRIRIKLNIILSLTRIKSFWHQIQVHFRLDSARHQTQTTARYVSAINYFTFYTVMTLRGSWGLLLGLRETIFHYII